MHDRQAGGQRSLNEAAAPLGCEPEAERGTQRSREVSWQVLIGVPSVYKGGWRW